MTRSRASTFLACVLAAGAPAFAQSHDPQQRPVVLRIQLADGTPMPGVPIVRDRGDAAAPAADGWLRHSDRRLSLAARPVVGRSDPEGKLTVLASDGNLGPREIEAAPPFRSRVLARDGGQYVLCVERLEQFVVQAIDAAGAPLVDFPLALQCNGQNEALALTDGRGFATFGVDPATSARLVVAPFGWIGPTEGLPTVAKQLPGKHLLFQVPPFGRVRVRATVGGAPKALPIHGARLHEPRGTYWSPDRGETTGFDGVEFGPVAVGQPLQGSVRFDSGEVPFHAPAVSRPGEIVVVDVDADPARPQFEVQVVAPGVQQHAPSGKQAVSVRVSVTLHTDAGRFRLDATPDAGGRVRVVSDRATVLGQRLRRVDVDVEEDVVEGTSAGLQRRSRYWSGSVAIDRALENSVMDLGPVATAPHPGLLRGRVVDERGRPVQGATVEITDAERTGARLQHWTGDDGRFEVSGPLLRDQHGNPAMVVAAATLGFGVDAVRSEPSAPVAAGSEVTLVLATPARGFVELTLRDPRALPTHALQFAFVEASGRVREIGHDRIAWGERNQTCRLGPLPPGRGALRIQLRPGVLLRTIADLEVTAGGVCRDPRLADVDLSDAATACRMRVVDEQGVPIAGARVEYRGASDQWSIGPSDGGGVLEIIKGPPKALRIVVSAPGKQPVAVGEVVDGGDIRLRALPCLCVAVKGLPPDLARADLAVFCRSVVRENLADQSQASLGVGDVANVPLPPPGRYHLRLTIAQPAGAGTSWTLVGQRSDDVLVGLDGETLEFAVDEAMVQRLRQLLAK